MAIGVNEVDAGDRVIVVEINVLGKNIVSLGFQFFEVRRGVERAIGTGREVGVRPGRPVGIAISVVFVLNKLLTTSSVLGDL